MCIRSSLHSVRFGQLIRCEHKRIVNFYYNDSVHRTEQLTSGINTRFRKQYRLYSSLRLRSEEVREPLYIYCLFARWQLLATNILITRFNKI